MFLLIRMFLAVGFYEHDNNALLPCTSHYDTLTKQQIYFYPEKTAAPKEGMALLFSKILKKMDYSSSGSIGSEGKIIVAFVVDRDGQVIGKRIMKDAGANKLANQVLDAIDDSKWIAGECNSKRVPTLVVVPMFVCLKSN